MQSVTLAEAMDRREPPWTQEELERESGVSQTTISEIRRGVNRNPSTKVVRNLERALKLQRGQLQIDVEEQKQSRLPLKRKTA